MKKIVTLGLLAGLMFPLTQVSNIFAATQPSVIPNVFVSTSHQSAVTAPYEPSSGIYLGMFVKDDLTQSLAQQAGDTSPNAALKYVAQGYGKQPAIYLTYANFYEPFPTSFANTVKSLHGSVQIGWQPEVDVNGTTESLDYLFNQHLDSTESYIHQFIADAKASGVPVFLRFGAEMNGNWTPWHSDSSDGTPDYSLYKQAWIDVWNEIQALNATNVVMVFSPNAITNSSSDKQEVLDFYPGDKYVGWIGESLYAYTDTPNLNIVSEAQPLYDLFKSHNKPMMISEGAAVSEAPSDWPNGGTLTDYSNWATTEISGLMNIVPKEMPLIKAVTYFNQSSEQANLTTNNKDLTFAVDEHPKTLNAFKNAIADSDYLSTVQTTGNAAPNNRAFIPLENSGPLTGSHTVSPEIVTNGMQPPAKVVATQNGTTLATATAAPWNMTIDFTNVSPTQPVEFTAYDGSGNALAQGSFQVKQHWVYVDQKVALHDNDSFDGSTTYISPQSVNVYQQNGRWYQIQSYLGPKWIDVPYVNQKLPLTSQTPLYDQPDTSYQTGASLAPQTVNVVQDNEDWVEIQTWIGNKWIFLPHLQDELIVPNNVLLWNSDSKTAATSGSIDPQTVQVLQGTPNGWFQIQTSIGPEWISLSQEQNQLTLTATTTLYGSPSTSSTTYGTLSPQTVTILKSDGNGWYEIQTYLGPKWIYVSSN